jgi:hypothetical protein
MLFYKTIKKRYRVALLIASKEAGPEVNAWEETMRVALYVSDPWGPEDDSGRVETRSPSYAIVLLRISLCCVLTDTFYPMCYINTSGWKTSTLYERRV